VLARRVPLRRSAPPRRKTPIRSGKPPDRRVPVRKARGRPRRGPERSADYLAWIRTLGCVVCSRVSTSQIAIEAAHTNALGCRGLSQKSSDYSAIPLCPSHHRENTDSYHRLGEQRFAREHQINLRGLVDGLNRLFERYGPQTNGLANLNLTALSAREWDNEGDARAPDHDSFSPWPPART
jgi:hypothetical protein